METQSRPKGRSMRELRRLIDEDAARFNELAEAWNDLTEREQVTLVKWAKERAVSA